MDDAYAEHEDCAMSIVVSSILDIFPGYNQTLHPILDRSLPDARMQVPEAILKTTVQEKNSSQTMKLHFSFCSSCISS